MFISSCSEKCDLDLRLFSVFILEQNGQNAHIHTTETLNTTGTVVYSNTYEGNTDHDLHFIIDSGILNESQSLTFRAYRNDSLLVESQYYASADECGIYELQGADTLFLP